jgi:hypothetical protein
MRPLRPFQANTVVFDSGRHVGVVLAATLSGLQDTGEYSISDLAEVFSVSRPTVYRTHGRQRPAAKRGKRTYSRLISKHSNL